MMPGVTIQTGLPLAGVPAARSASAAAGDRFSDSLHGKPNDSAQTGKADGRTVKDRDDAVDGDVGTRPLRQAAEEEKDGKPANARDDSESTKDEDGTKDKDDRTASALPPHIQAERAFARQWPASAPTTAGGPAPGRDDKAAASVVQAAGAGPANGSTAIRNAAGIAAMTGKTRISALDAAPTAEASKGGPTSDSVAAPVPANRTIADPTPKSVPMTGVTTAEIEKPPSGDPSAAFAAKVAALRNGGDPTGSAAKADGAATKGTGSVGPGLDRGDGTPARPAPHAAAVNGAQQSASARVDASPAPLPTAQMLPASGSATSFASALAQGGALARHTTNAAAAIAAGAPAGSLPAQSLSIQLRPVELGAVTANLKYVGSGLTIDIAVETPEAHRRLSNDSSDIVKSLQSLGFQVDKVTVRQASAQIQTQAQTQNSPQGQSLLRDGPAGGFTGQGGAHSSLSGQSDGHRKDTEHRHDNGAEGSIGMVQQAADRLPRRGVFI